MSKYKLATYTPVHLTEETIRFVLTNLGSDALALYVAYVGVVQWQQTNRVRATTGFMAERMGWGKEKLKKVKKLLVDNGYVEDYKKRNEENKIIGWYVQVKYLVRIKEETTRPENHPLENPTGGEKDPQVLYKESLSALEKKESALENSFSLKHNYDVIREQENIEIDRTVASTDLFVREQDKVKIRIPKHLLEEE